MFYVAAALVGLWVLWLLSEWYTEKKIDILVRRLEKLEEAETQCRVPRNGSWTKGMIIEAEVRDPELVLPKRNDDG